MHIRDELTSFLDRQTREHSSTDKERNIEIISCYYGFGQAELPTYREVARRFPSINSRERVRQIVDQFFRRPVKDSDLPSMSAFRDLLEKRSYWQRSELESAIETAHLLQGRFSIKGLFRLMMDLEIEHGYGIYTGRLRTASRTSASDSEKFFIIRESEIEKIRSLYDAALKLPGKYGIANLNYLRTECNFSTYETLIDNLIENAPDRWKRRVGGALWYILENRSNPLTTLSKRVFSIMEACQVERLAGAYRSGLLRRSYEHAFPSVALVSEYLRTFPKF